MILGDLERSNQGHLELRYDKVNLRHPLATITPLL